MTEPRVVTYPDKEELARSVASWLTDRAVAKKGRFAISLSGGSTPKRLYEVLATEPYRTQMPWDRVHFFFGDERFVPHDSEDSNYRMVRRAMLDHVPVPPSNIYPIRGTGTAQDSARDYQRELQNFYGSEALDMTRPLFDVNLMGLGEDGHTASLFPGNPALEEAVAWVLAVTDPSVSQERITLTYPVLACSAAVAFLVEGEKKRAALRRVLDGDRTVPAARATSAGELIWFTDRAAIG